MIENTLLVVKGATPCIWGSLPATIDPIIISIE